MKPLSEQQSKTDYITLLSVVAAFSVVFLHANGCFWTYSTARYWFTANIIESFFYFAVPTFFMITGATLLDYRDRYSTKEYAVKRIKKTVIPFLVWSLLGVLYKVLRGWITPDMLSFKFVFGGILDTKIIPIYWFFTALFGVYLCIPLFSAIPKEKRKTIFSYLAIASFVFNSFIPFLFVVFSPDYYWPVSVTVGTEYLMYVLVGYLINEYDLPKYGKILIYVSSLAGLLIHIIGTYQFSTAAGYLNQSFKGYNNAPSVMYSVGIFLFFKEYGNKIMNSFLRKPIKFLSNYTFGLYLIHIYILELFRDGFSFSVYSIVYRLGSPFVVICIAIAILFVIKKIPYLNKIIP